MPNVIWSPQPKQLLFLQRPEYEALYGGAAGGGKSEAIVMEALRQVHIPHYKGLILRKTYPQLSELIDKTHRYYPRAYPKARYNASEHYWLFPSGAKIILGSMQRVADREKYQGQAYDYVAFDELTHFTFDEYNFLFTRNRPNGPGTRAYIRATANPGGVGHGWVKERFISNVPPMTTAYAKVKWIGRTGKEEEVTVTRIFVPASVYDNQVLLENDPLYVSRLAMMPDAEKKAFLYGDWNSFTGQVFTEWRNDPEHYEDRIGTHVIKPFRVPDGWRIYRGFDFGYSRPFSVGWYAVDHDRRMYRIRELYGCTDRPNEGVKWTTTEIAEKILQIEDDDPNLKGKKILGIADPSIYDESRGESIAQGLARKQVYFDRADNSRIAGKMQLHNRLQFVDGVPMLYVFSTCTNFIRTFPALVYDQSNVEDVDSSTEDHIYDECRYVAMENPVASQPVVSKEPKPYDPLSNEKLDRYDFYRR